MISYSFLLLIIGMGTVFTFLLLLVGSMNLLAYMTAGIRQAEIDAKALATAPKKPIQNVQQNDETLLGVIASAIHTHRSRT